MTGGYTSVCLKLKHPSTLWFAVVPIGIANAAVIHRFLTLNSHEKSLAVDTRMRVIPFPLLNTPQKPSLRGWNHWLGPFRGGSNERGNPDYLYIYIYRYIYNHIYIYIYVCIPLTPYAITMFKWLNHGWNRVPFGKPVTNLTFIPQPLFCQAYCGDQGSWQGENLWISFGYPAHRYIYICVCVYFLIL